jgi:hypothetical protein
MARGAGMSAYLPSEVVADIRSDPSRIVDYFNTYRSQFIADLNLPAMDEAALKAAWCCIVSYNMAEYGSGPGNDYAALLASPALECTGYVTLAWHLMTEFGISTEDQAAVGWYDGAVGNHSQLLVSINGTNLLLDPTIGLVVYDVTLEDLVDGVAFSEYASFYHRDDITTFNSSVILAITEGRYRVQDAIYYVPGLDNWLNDYGGHVGLTLEHGDDSQTIIGYIGDDVIDAGAGDDILSGGRGNDTLIGGSGFDRAIYSGHRSDYVIDFIDGGFRITHAVSGTDTLYLVEEINFADYSLHLKTDDFDQFLWDAETRSFDQQGNLVSILYNLDDGGSQLYDYDPFDLFAWTRVVTFTDADGDRTRILYDQNDGKHVGYQYDIDNTAAWSSIVTYYDSNWQVDRHLYNQDDGSRVLYQYDYDGAGAWTRITTYYEADWDVTKRIYDQDDGTKVMYEYDHGASAWDRITTYFTTAGGVSRRLYDQDDNTHVLYQYDTEGSFAWDKLERYYRADWTPAREVIRYDDGAQVVIDFDERGNPITSANYEFDWLLS